jgi:hypothetical protein
MNHRIARVRVSIDRKEVGDFKLDTSRRDLQPIALATKGRSIRLEVLEVEPGSKSNWKETCISELELWGRTHQPLTAKGSPVVRVDSPAFIVCPSKDRLAQLVRARSAFAKAKSTVDLAGCYAGRFPKGTLYVTAVVIVPSNDPAGYGDRYLFCRIRNLVAFSMLPRISPPSRSRVTARCTPQPGSL